MGFLSQFAALYIKNALVAWRARRATLLRLLAPFFFLLLALLIDKALQANDSNSEDFQDIRRPDVEPIDPIPRCIEDIYIGPDKSCVELAWSPNTSTIATTIIQNVIKNNAKPIKAMGFATRDDAQAFLLGNPDYIIAGVHFVIDTASALQGFIIQTNTTAKAFKSKYQDPNTFVQLPLQSAVHREIARYGLAQNPATAATADSLSWFIGLKSFPHPTIATVSVLGQVLGPFVFAACMFSFVTQISSVVMEKEGGLRQAMRTMGMTDAAFWCSWGMWEVTLAFVSGHLITCFGLILHLKLFLKNNYGLLFFLFFLFQLAMSSLALLVSAFLRRTQTAVYLGFVIFIVGWVMQTVVIFGVPYTPDYYTKTSLSKALTVIFSMLPWDLLVKGFKDLDSAVVQDGSDGLRWSERSRYCQNIPNADDQSAWANANNYDPREEYVSFECVMPLDTIYKVLVALWAGYFVLAVYFDAVVPNEFGIRRPVLYFLYPSYWLPSVTSPASALKHVLKEDGQGPRQEGGEVDEDVAAEESRMRGLLNHRTGHTAKGGELAGQGAGTEQRNAVEVYGLKKRFGGSGGCCGNSVVCCGAFDCCSCKAADAFWPIKGSWFSIAENSLFCLLGPNGAGKTTTINCLTGVLPPSYGDALVYGQSIRSSGGLNQIRSQMGVCPQFDVLWPELTGREHLLLYGRIKGVRGWKGAAQEAEELLDKVKLGYAATQRTGAYSGGMKRRLSVAISLLGDPKIVYLDEPTTGMDPISRRYVWDIIEKAKEGRAIILTTHSMEEADILGDRIAIMALGRLRCIGSSIRLKQRFGTGYQVACSVQPPRGSQADLVALAQRAAGLKAYFKERLGLEPVDESKVYMSFLVPRDQEAALISFLRQLEKDAAGLGVTDTQMSLTSLEEVFLTIARKAALEAAQAGHVGRRKREIHFCGALGRGLILVTFFPFSLLTCLCWDRFCWGKFRCAGGCISLEAPKDAGATTVDLPDGTTHVLQPGQEFFQTEGGQAYKVIWSVDESGNLVAQEAKPIEQMPATTPRGPGALPVAAPVALAGGAQPPYANGAANGHAGNGHYAAGTVVHNPVAAYPVGPDGKARVPLPGNVLMEVPLGSPYVMNPLDGATYYVQWGKQGGVDAVLSCTAVPTMPTAAAAPAAPGGYSQSAASNGSRPGTPGSASAVPINGEGAGSGRFYPAVPK
eukprot:CAMPEP_0202859992 /NCGR_PEP_ID=MMETSP1391-20130828/1884_1 /ASSEMBLY_ACC=CAM_ASM_000867 /TAXON_ID=1034604 /ORGANISM="Chlamydomonas leiostraca, Strain SAG 11-49" /LENGTH=1190 /DNA_ID=CAMNT_0049539111 /DNA_START=105 /DNA_END=3677 /DNA_ORIENTATION=-